MLVIRLPTSCLYHCSRRARGDQDRALRTHSPTGARHGPIARPRPMSQFGNDSVYLLRDSASRHLAGPLSQKS